MAYIVNVGFFANSCIFEHVSVCLSVGLSDCLSVCLFVCVSRSVCLYSFLCCRRKRRLMAQFL